MNSMMNFLIVAVVVLSSTEARLLNHHSAKRHPSHVSKHPVHKVAHSPAKETYADALEEETSTDLPHVAKHPVHTVSHAPTTEETPSDKEGASADEKETSIDKKETSIHNEGTSTGKDVTSIDSPKDQVSTDKEETSSGKDVISIDSPKGETSTDKEETSSGKDVISIDSPKGEKSTDKEETSSGKDVISIDSPKDEKSTDKEETSIHKEKMPVEKKATSTDSSKEEEEPSTHSAPPSLTTCVPLDNKGSHFTVDIQVGTPGQTFSVVADTGSDAVIVPSCICQDSGSCSGAERCFRGANKSSSFVIRDVTMPLVGMTFGSGRVEGLVATDVVHVGSRRALMQDGVVLMTGKQLAVPGPFEGILGLGPPKPKVSSPSKSGGMDKMMKDLKKLADALKGGSGAGGGSGGGPMGEEGEASPKISRAEVGGGDGEITTPMSSVWRSQTDARIEGLDGNTILDSSPSFLQAAGVSSFTMCFNDQGKQGALYLGSTGTGAEKSLVNVGKAHWGLDFQGVSVGDATANVSFCSPSSKSKGQETACGAIPDSGTTLFTAPSDHIMKLIEELCDNWERCRVAASTGLQPRKADLFLLLLRECGSWMETEDALDEMPKLHFHLAGADGEKQTLVLGGGDYVIETQLPEVKTVTKNVMGMPMKMQNKTGKMKTLCEPAFAPMQFNTELNGPVWILGAPLFYKYTVGYELKGNKSAVSFAEKPCGCKPHLASSTKQKLGFISSSRSIEQPRRSGKPRRMYGEPRMPSFDLSNGL